MKVRKNVRKLLALPRFKPNRVVVLAAEMRRHGWALWRDGKREMSGVTKNARSREVVVQSAQHIADRHHRCLVPVLELPDPWLPRRVQLEMAYRVGGWLEQLDIATIPGWVGIELHEWRELVFGKKNARLGGKKLRQRGESICEAMHIKVREDGGDVEAHMIALWGSQAEKVEQLIPPSALFRQDYVGRVWMPRVIDGGQST